MASLVAMLVLLSAVGGSGQAPAREADSLTGVQLRFQGDVAVPVEGREAFILVVDGDARVEGEVGTLVVVGGSARLIGARVENLAVARGLAELSDGTVVSGDVHLVDGDIQVDGSSSVVGRIDRGYAREALHGVWLVGAMVAFGLTIAMLAAGIVAAAVAPAAIRRAGAALTAMPGATAIAALVVWIGVPIAAGLLVATIVGIPTALAVLFFALPALGFIGFLVSGIRIGDWVILRLRGRIEPAHPYLAAIAGLLILVVAGWLPLVGGFVTLLAGIGGGGAVALIAWHAARSQLPTAGPAPPSS